MEADLCLSACNAFTISAISNINQLFYPSTTAVQTVDKYYINTVIGGVNVVKQYLIVQSIFRCFI